MKFEIIGELKSESKVYLPEILQLLINAGYHIVKRAEEYILFEDYDRNGSQPHSKISDLYKVESGKIEFIDENVVKLNYTISIMWNFVTFIITLICGFYVYPGFFFFSFIVLILFAFKMINVRSSIKDLFIKSLQKR